MKRSTKVALTLFLPAISSFGCDTAKKPTFAKPTNCSTPAKPGEPPKETVCDPNAANQSNHNTVTHHRPSLFPWFWMWGGGSSRSGINAAPNAPASNTSHTSGLGSSQTHYTPSANSSRVSSGGFGRTGGAMSASS